MNSRLVAPATHPRHARESRDTSLFQINYKFPKEKYFGTQNFIFDLRDRRIKQTKINQNRKKTTNENITNHKIEHIIYMKMNLASI